MSDTNAPDPREHAEEPAEGPDDASADPGDTDEAAPDEDLALNTIEPPPPVDASMQGVPETSDALGDIDPDEPGANATGIGV